MSPARRPSRLGPILADELASRELEVNDLAHLALLGFYALCQHHLVTPAVATVLSRLAELTDGAPWPANIAARRGA